MTRNSGAKKMTFCGIAIEVEVPSELKVFFNERLDIRSIFGRKCYVILEDDDKSPFNLLDEDDHRKVERWLATIDSKDVFLYTWNV